MSLSTNTANGGLSWIKDITRYQWMVFLVAWLGWMLDATDFGLFAPNFGQSDNGTAISLPSADYAALDAFAAANGLSLTSVPEPASLGLLMLGAVGVLSRRRRKECRIG